MIAGCLTARVDHSGRTFFYSFGFESHEEACSVLPRGAGVGTRPTNCWTTQVSTCSRFGSHCLCTRESRQRTSRLFAFIKMHCESNCFIVERVRAVDWDKSQPAERIFLSTSRCAIACPVAKASRLTGAIRWRCQLASGRRRVRRQRGGLATPTA